MKVGISGVSSFTGTWLALGLADDGHEVHGLLSKTPAEYTGVRAHRLGILKQSKVILHASVKSETGDMAAWIRHHRPSIWIHHHHFMDNFRSRDFDVGSAKRVALDPLTGLVEALKYAGTSQIIFSSSYFEPGEGACVEPALPYAITKFQTWKELSQLAASIGIPAKRVVIPNPVGPFENDDRLIPMVVRKARLKETIQIQNADSTADNLPIWDLVQTYKDALTSPQVEWRPSAKPETTLRMAQMAAEQLGVHGLGFTMPEIKADATPGTARHARNSTESKAIDWPPFWARYAQELKNSGYVP